MGGFGWDGCALRLVFGGDVFGLYDMRMLYVRDYRSNVGWLALRFGTGSVDSHIACRSVSIAIEPNVACFNQDLCQC